jgi:hypothetical protein
LSDLINNITGGINLNFGNGQTFNINSNPSNNYSEDLSENEEENSIPDSENEEEEFERQMMEKRKELILELNEFQFKNVNKFLSRTEEYVI